MRFYEIVLIAIQGAWDSYVQGTGGNNLDPSIWPLNFDMMGDAQMSQQQQQGQSNNANGGVFMGSTGGPANMM